MQLSFSICFNPSGIVIANTITTITKNILLDHFSNRFYRRSTHEKWMLFEHEIDCKFSLPLRCPFPFFPFFGVHAILFSCFYFLFLLYILSAFIFLPSRHVADGFYYSFPFIRYIKPDFTLNTKAEQCEQNTGP